LGWTKNIKIYTATHFHSKFLMKIISIQKNDKGSRAKFV
jgi:hypothetical protein